MADPADLGLLEAAALLRSRELSARELTEACLKRIEERNGGPPSDDGAPEAINAWARVYPELARERAAAADRRLDHERELAPLVCGIPLAVKDLYAISGLPLTASSRVLADNVAERDATAWARLRAVGMVPRSAPIRAVRCASRPRAAAPRRSSPRTDACRWTA